MLRHGIDLHKHSVVIGAVDDSGTLIASKRLALDVPTSSATLNTADGPHTTVVETMSTR